MYEIKSSMKIHVHILVGRAHFQEIITGTLKWLLEEIINQMW
jgi:hypothetical protein